MRKLTVQRRQEVHINVAVVFRYELLSQCRINDCQQITDISYSNVTYEDWFSQNNAFAELYASEVATPKPDPWHCGDKDEFNDIKVSKIGQTVKVVKGHIETDKRMYRYI